MQPENVLPRIRKQFRLSETADDALLRRGSDDVLAALEHFAELLPADEQPTRAVDLLDDAAGTNAFDPLRQQRRLPVTILFYARVHPAYFEGDSRIGEAAWRLCYTDGGAVGTSPAQARLLDEVIRLAEAMHDKNPFGEVPFDGGKTILVQEGAHFQAVTALFGALGMSLFILGKGGVRYYSNGTVSTAQKRTALERWAESSMLAGVLAAALHRRSRHAHGRGRDGLGRCGGARDGGGARRAAAPAGHGHGRGDGRIPAPGLGIDRTDGRRFSPRILAPSGDGPVRPRRAPSDPRPHPGLRRRGRLRGAAADRGGAARRISDRWGG